MTEKVTAVKAKKANLVVKKSTKPIEAQVKELKEVLKATEPKNPTKPTKDAERPAVGSIEEIKVDLCKDCNGNRDDKSTFGADGCEYGTEMPECSFHESAEALVEVLKGEGIDAKITDVVVDPYVGLDFIQLNGSNYSYSEMKSEIYITIKGEKKVLFIKKEQKWMIMPQAGDVLNFKNKKVYVGGIATYDILYPTDVEALTPEVEPEKEKSFDQIMLEQRKHAIDPKGKKGAPKGTDLPGRVVATSAETPIGGVNSTPVMVKHAGQGAMVAGLKVEGNISGIAAPSQGASL